MLCIYEDEGYRNLGPLVSLRAVFELRCGRWSLLEKLKRHYRREKMAVWVRKELKDVVAERYPDIEVNLPVEPPALFISAGLILDRPLPVRGDEEMFLVHDRPVGFRLKKTRNWLKPGLQHLRPDKHPELPCQPIDARFIAHPWDLVELNPGELKKDLPGRCALTLMPGARVHKGATVSTESGPVFLDKKSEVRPGSVVAGPCYIGPETVIDGALIRPGCSFGPQCRIGGEVEQSIFQGFSNKHHEGFIGHSFIGEWVNLGALTTCSDLKNNYQPVRVKISGKTVETGLLKVGCFIGDHVKTGIGTFIPTGAVLGTFANWFEPGLTPKELPDFAWGKQGRWQMAKIVACCEAVMRRRGMTPSPAYQRLLLTRYRHSQP